MNAWPNWTRWYHGISHRENLRRGVRISAQKYSGIDWVTVALFLTRSYDPNVEDVFTAKDWFFGPEKEALAWGETIAKKYLD